MFKFDGNFWLQPCQNPDDYYVENTEHGTRICYGEQKPSNTDRAELIQTLHEFFLQIMATGGLSGPLNFDHEAREHGLKGRVLPLIVKENFDVLIGIARKSLVETAD